MTSTRKYVFPPIAERYLSREIIEEREGEPILRHALSVIEIKRNEAGEIESYRITPFSGETCYTAYRDKPVRVAVSRGGAIELYGV